MESELLVFITVVVVVIVVKSLLNRWQSKRMRTLCTINRSNSSTKIDLFLLNFIGASAVKRVIFFFLVEVIILFFLRVNIKQHAKEEEKNSVWQLLNVERREKKNLFRCDHFAHDQFERETCNRTNESIFIFNSHLAWMSNRGLMRGTKSKKKKMREAQNERESINDVVNWIC